jgi:hypothetical protein
MVFSRSRLSISRRDYPTRVSGSCFSRQPKVSECLAAAISEMSNELEIGSRRKNVLGDE